MILNYPLEIAKSLINHLIVHNLRQIIRLLRKNTIKSEAVSKN